MSGRFNWYINYMEGLMIMSLQLWYYYFIKFLKKHISAREVLYYYEIKKKYQKRFVEKLYAPETNIGIESNRSCTRSGWLLQANNDNIKLILNECRKALWCSLVIAKFRNFTILVLSDNLAVNSRLRSYREWLHQRQNGIISMTILAARLCSSDWTARI